MGPYRAKLTTEAYHAHPAINSTSLKDALRSPAHYAYRKAFPIEPTPAMQFGTIAHEAILEPDKFKNTAVICPEFSGTGSRAAKADWLKENAGKRILTVEQMANVEGMLAAIANHSTAKALLFSGRAEDSMFCTDSETGLELKARPDFLRDDRTIIDVKTTIDANPMSFGKVVANFGYHTQAWHYAQVVSEATGHEHTRFVIIAVEREAPWGVAVFEMSENVMAQGRRLQRKALQIIAESKASGRWPSYGDGLFQLDLPAWALVSE